MFAGPGTIDSEGPSFLLDHNSDYTKMAQRRTVARVRFLVRHASNQECYHARSHAVPTVQHPGLSPSEIHPPGDAVPCRHLRAIRGEIPRDARHLFRTSSEGGRECVSSVRGGKIITSYADPTMVPPQYFHTRPQREYRGLRDGE